MGRAGRAAPTPSSTRPPARSSRRRRSPPPRTSTARCKAASGAFEGWSNTTPGERALALLRLADALEEHGDEIAALEVANAGKPAAAFKGDELPVMADNLRFFAGCARTLEGKAAGEYLEGYTSFIRREAIGAGGADHAVELPADDGDLEDRPGAGRRQHDRPQAGRDDAADHAQARRDRGRVPAQGRAQRDRRARRDRPGARHRIPTSAWSRSPARSRPASGSPSAAADTLKRVHLELGGKAPGRRLRRRRHGGRRSRRSPARASTTPARTAPRPRACSPPARSTTTCCNGLAEQAKGYKMGDLYDEDTTLGPVNSQRQRERVAGFLERRAGARRDRHGRQAARSARLLARADGRRRPASRTTR